jgi:HD-GYP domain-containing protein (c-di-GMP phosphodiesterase class II)
MRFVPVNCIKEGAIVGKKLFGKSGEVLLNTGTVIQSSFIEKIKEHGYNGIYIEDDLSKDIEVVSLISDELKFKAIMTLKDTFSSIEKDKILSKNNIKNLSTIVDNILEEILSNKDLLINIIDIKAFDDYTYYHSVNVSLLSIVIGISLNLNKATLNNLGLAAILHDIGKVFIDKNILNKSGCLTKEEYEIIKAHPNKGYEYLKTINHFPAQVYTGILHHHEKYNGNGYPLSLKGDNICLLGKIIAVADVYDAMTSNRPYRKALLPSEAIEYLMGACGSLFDGEIVKCFIEKISPYPLGTLVQLSNNAIGLVLENYKDCCLRPKVRVFLKGDTKVEPYIIDLRNDPNARNITIVGLVDI